MKGCDAMVGWKLSVAACQLDQLNEYCIIYTKECSSLVAVSNECSIFSVTALTHINDMLYKRLLGLHYITASELISLQTGNNPTTASPCGVTQNAPGLTKSLDILTVINNNNINILLLPSSSYPWAESP